MRASVRDYVCICACVFVCACTRACVRLCAIVYGRYVGVFVCPRVCVCVRQKSFSSRRARDRSHSAELARLRRARSASGRSRTARRTMSILYFEDAACQVDRKQTGHLANGTWNIFGTMSSATGQVWPDIGLAYLEQDERCNV